MTRTATRTLGEYLEEYETRRDGRVVARTLECEMITCRRFAAWWDARRLPLDQLTTIELDDWLHGKGGLAYKVRHPDIKLEKTAFNKELSRLKGFITWMVMRGVLPPILMQTLQDARHRKAKPRQMIRLDLAQLDELVTGAEDPWEKFILAAFVYTAGREGELLSRQIVHLNTDQRLDWYRTKTEDADRVPIMPELEEAVREWLTYYTTIKGELQGDWYLVPARQRSRSVTWGYDPTRAPTMPTVAAVVQKHVARVLKVDAKSELVGQACHLLRRSAALAMYKVLIAAGYTDALRIVMSWLGHTKQETTEIYLGLESGRERRDEVLLNGNRWMTPDRSNVIAIPKLKSIA